MIDISSALIEAVGLTVGCLAYANCDPSREAFIKLRTETGEFEPVIKTPRKKHGLIVLGGDGSKELRRDVKKTSDLVYDTLIETGYKSEDLYVLEGKDKPSGRFGCNMLASSKKDLSQAFDAVDKKDVKGKGDAAATTYPQAY